MNKLIKTIRLIAENAAWNTTYNATYNATRDATVNAIKQVLNDE